MSNDSPLKALIVVLVTALICSTLVSAAVVVLRPIQLNNQLLERSRNIMALTGLMPAGEVVEDEKMLELFRSLDTRMVDIDEAQFDSTINPLTFDLRRAANDPDLSTAVPPGSDPANIGRRSRYAPVYIVWDGDQMDRMILPVRGAGMWSMLYGYIAIQPDLSTIAGMTIYEQNETPGLGDQIAHPKWLAGWQGKQIYDHRGTPLFTVAEGEVEPGSAQAPYQVDGLTGATVTGNAVTALIRYWFGPHGYRPFLDELKEHPPERGEGTS
jgi:Na+-transporting NADH:ubiquinone oxidoreductase subunit C